MVETRNEQTLVVRKPEWKNQLWNLAAELPAWSRVLLEKPIGRSDTAIK
jgi:hypothetical protein